MPCLTANENFHSYVVDLVLEKFTSDLEIAKTDSLILMVCRNIFNSFSLLYFVNSRILLEFMTYVWFVETMFQRFSI